MAIATKIVYLVSGLMTVGGVGWYFVMNFCKSKKLLQFNTSTSSNNNIEQDEVDA